MAFTWQVIHLGNEGFGQQTVELVEDADGNLGPAGAVAAAYGQPAAEFERTTRGYAGFVAIRPAAPLLDDQRPVAFYVRRLRIGETR